MDREDQSSSDENSEAPTPSLVKPLGPQAQRESRTQAAKRIFEERRMRSQHFTDRDLFGEPAWDILLQLFLGHSNRRGVKIEDVTITSGLTMTSALRLLEFLEHKGLIFAYRGEENTRQIYLRLSSRGLLEMAQYLDRVARR